MSLVLLGTEIKARSKYIKNHPPLINCPLARGVRSPSVIAISGVPRLKGEEASCRPTTGEDWKFMGDDDFGWRLGVPRVRLACEEEAASPSNCEADGSGGLLGGAWELRFDERFGVPETELLCRRCAGDDIATIISAYIGAAVNRKSPMWMFGERLRAGSRSEGRNKSRREKGRV